MEDWSWLTPRTWGMSSRTDQKPVFPQPRLTGIKRMGEAVPMGREERDRCHHVSKLLLLLL